MRTISSGFFTISFASRTTCRGDATDAIVLLGPARFAPFHSFTSRLRANPRSIESDPSAPAAIEEQLEGFRNLAARLGDRQLQGERSQSEFRPNNELIGIYSSDKNGSYSEMDGPSLRWDKPQVEALVDFLSYHQHWEPSYIRQRLLPMLSTIFLREMASTPNDALLLYDQYEFHSIERVKIRYGHPYYVVKWKRAGNSSENFTYSIPSERSVLEESEAAGVTDSTDTLDESDIPLVLVDDGCWFLLTDENMELVQAAFPATVDKFLEEKRIKESISKQRKSSSGLSKRKGGSSELPNPSGVQLSITEFYRAAKVRARTKACEDSEGSRANRNKPTDSDKNLPKSVRRRLLFG